MAVVPEIPSLDVPQMSLNFLTSEEESSLSEIVRSKVLQKFQELTRNYHNAVNQKQRDKETVDQNLQGLQTQVKEFQDRTESLNTQLQNERKTTEEYIERYRKALTTTNELEDQVRKLQANFTEGQVKIQQLETEKEDLVAIVEKRNNELETMNGNLKSFSDQLQSATAAKIDALVKVDELTSKEMELDYKEKQLNNEKEWVNKQVQLLNEELDRKNREIIELHRDSALKFLQLQAEVSEKAEQLRLSELSVTHIKQSSDEQEAHIERLMQKLKESQDLEAKMEENYRQELKSQKRIAELYKEASEEANKKGEELEDAVSNLQEMLKLATERYGEMETKFNKCGKSFQEEVTKRDEQIESLKEELSRANELLNNINKQGLTDAMITSLSPAAAAACSLLKSSHSLTEIYSKHQTLQEQLLAAKEENERLNDYIKQILRDIEDRAPLMRVQKEDYERALETISNLQIQVDLATDAEQAARSELGKARMLERENERLMAQLKDSAMQIKALLREVEINRGGIAFNSTTGDISAQEVPDVASSASYMDSSRLISERLVVFRNIDELQQQNQYLLSLVRELSQEREKSEESVEEKRLREVEVAIEVAKREALDARSRHDRMLQSVIEQRDAYAAQVAQLQKSPGPGRSPIKTPVGIMSPMASGDSIGLTEQSNKINALEKQVSELTFTYNKLKEEYDNYRKEKREHEKIASEQMERLRDDLTRIRSENAKLSSQTEYSNETSKIYAANLETYKKNINILEEKNKQCNVTIMKHEQSIVALKSEIATVTNSLAKAEVSLSSMIQERNMLRDAKAHLQAEKELLQKEQMTQKVLQLNLADIKNNLEMGNSAGKIRLENQLESLQKECNILRRRVDTENERFKDTVLSWDKMNKDLATKLAKEEEAHDEVKKQLAAAQDNIKSQRTEIDELLTKIRVLTGSSTQGHVQLDTVPALAQVELEKKTKELNLKLIESQTEIRGLKQQLELTRSSVEEYKNLATSLEQQLQNASVSRESYNNELSERLACKDDIIREIQAKLNLLEAKHSKVLEENEKLQRDEDGKAVKADEELARLHRELQTANTKLQDLADENVKVRRDFEIQVRQSEEFRLKYESELQKQSQEMEVIELKESVNDLMSKLAEAERLKKKIEENFNEKHIQWQNQERTYKSQLEQVENNLKELESLNNSLQEQLIALTTQLSSLRRIQSQEGAGQDESSLNRSVESADVSLNTSFVEQSEQDKKSTEQWMQLIRYMRRQREIAFSQKELAQTAMQRMETQLQFLEKQHEELKAKLSESQDGSQITFMTSTKQAELLRKVETLSALTDSNRMLREEKESALKEVEELKVKLENIEREMQPLRQKNTELEAKCDSLETENTAVKQDTARWRSRASSLLEKSNKFNPEEWKKLETEKESLQKQVVSMSENVKKQQQEIARQNQTINRVQQQLTMLQSANTTLTNEKKSQGEELKKVTVECNRVKAEAESLRTELEQAKSVCAERDAQLKNVQGELSTISTQLESERGVVRQVKLIARKYKKSFEDAQKENETLLEQKSQLETTAATASTSAAVAPPETDNKETQEDGNFEKLPTEVASGYQAEISELQAKLQEINEANETLKREVEMLKSREERAKTALKATRDKIAAGNSRTSELESGICDLNTKLAALETSREEAEVRQAAIKSQYEGRISRLEKEKKELQASLAAGASAPKTDSSTPELVQENEKLKNEVEMQRQRILAIEKQYKLQLSQGQAKGTIVQEKAPVEPPKANIKPISGPKASQPSTSKQSTQMVLPGTSRPQPTASIRPMSMPRKATVMPTASSAPTVTPVVQQPVQQQHSVISPVVPLVAPVSQAQVSTSTPDQSSSIGDQQQLPVTSSATTGTNSANIRQATVQPTPAVSTPSTVVPTPTMSTSAVSVNNQNVGPDRESAAAQEEGPSTSSQVDEGDRDSEQVSSSEPSNNQQRIAVTPVSREQRVVQSSQVQSAPSSEIQPSVAREEPTPSTSISGPRPTQSTKRIRNSEPSSNEPKADEPETKRTRVALTTSVEREAEAMGHHQEPGQESGADQKSTIGSASGGAQDEEDDSDVIVIDSDDDEEEERPRYQTSSRPPARRGARVEPEEEEFDEEVEEEEVEEEEIVDEEERIEEEEEGEVGDEEEDEGMELHDDDESVGEPEEGREAESLEEVEEDNEVDTRRFSESEADNMMIVDESHDSIDRQLEEAEEDEENDVNTVEAEVQEDGEASPAPEHPRTSGGPTSSVEVTRSSTSVSGSSRPAPQVRTIARRGGFQGTSRQHQNAPSSGYGDEIDVSVVPSTPTLVIPRRTDGFAEAVSSPQVPSQQRFTFGSSAQGDTQDSRELEQYDDGTGRSVPSTPLQASPPEVSEISVEQQESMARMEGRGESSRESLDIQPSSSDAPARSGQEIPSITITTVTESTGRGGEQVEGDSAFEDVADDDEEHVPVIQVIPGRTESSVTSSEDKLDGTTSTVTAPQQPSTSSTSRPTSPSPSQGASSSEQQPPQHRVRPTPIIWDQPTSSSSSVQQQVPQQRIIRGARAGLAGHTSAQSVRPLMQMNPEQMSLQTVRGVFHPRGAVQQSARRSRPHGRGIMRGSRGTGPPY